MALGEDVELLGNAFEDMQEQNVRLQQQLKEKDDANFKLMSEKIKVCLISFVVNFLVTRVSVKKKTDFSRFLFPVTRTARLLQADELLKLLREEKELLGEYTTQLKNQKDSQMALVRKIEERERQVQVRAIKYILADFVLYLTQVLDPKVQL